MKKLLTIILSIMLVLHPLTVYAAMDTGQPFSDIKGHWAEAIIKKHYQMGMLEGYPDGTFKPDQTMQKSELVSLINRYFGLTEKADTNFTDVTGKEWYADDAAKAKYYGYIEDLQLRPNDKATREDVINMVSLIIDIEEQKVKENKIEFKDLDGVDAETKDKIEKFSQMGYINGYEDSTFKPEGTINRAEIMTIVENTLGYIVKSQEDADNLPATAEKVTIISPDIIIENREIKGDIYITPGVKGKVTIKNTKVAGQIEIAGSSSSNPVHLENIAAEKVVISKAQETPEVDIKGENTIGELKTKSKTNLKITGETKIKALKTQAKTELKLGDKTEIKNLTTEGETKVETEQGSKIGKLEAKSKTEVSGKGEIKKAYIKDNEVEIENKPGYTEVDSKVGKADIAGKQINSENDDYHSSSGDSSGGHISHDTTAPAVNDKILCADNEKANSIDISWTKAEDDSSEQANLKYIVYYSKDNNVDTVTNIEANGTAAGIYEADIDSKTVTGLEPGTSYYFNVIVKDKAGNKAVYETVSADTLSAHKIYKIEDLASIGRTNPESLEKWGLDENYVLMNDLDFASADSYRDPDTTFFEDINGDGKIEGLKAELTTGSGWKPIVCLKELNELVEIAKTCSIFIIFDINKDSSTAEVIDVARQIAEYYHAPSNMTDQEVVAYACSYSSKNVYTGFSGRFWGNGYSIDNLYINRLDMGQGLFKGIESGSIVDKLTMKDAEIKCGSKSGVLCGQATDSLIENCSIKNSKITLNTSFLVGGMVGISSKSTMNHCSVQDVEIMDENIKYNGTVGGLVGETDQDSLVKNCNAKGINITTYKEAGGLIGHNKANNIDNCKAEDCIIHTDPETGECAGGLIGKNEEAAVKNSQTKNCSIFGDGYLGGLIGQNIKGYIENCTAEIVRIETRYSEVGGLVGRSEDSNIKNCHVKKADLLAQTGWVGGLIGSFYSYLDLTVENCSAEEINAYGWKSIGGFVGDIGNNSGVNVNFVDNYVTGEVTGSFETGGFVGCTNDDEIDPGRVVFDKCYAQTDVHGTRDLFIGEKNNMYLGGFAGYLNAADMHNCYSLGDIIAGDNNVAGGFTGYMNKSMLSDSYATGSVTSKQYAGGLIGHNVDSVVKNSITFNPYIICNGVANRIVGFSEGSAEFANNYANITTHVWECGTEKTGTSDPVSVWGADITSMRGIDDEPLTRWNFETVWEIKDGSGRPTLQNVGDDNGELVSSELNTTAPTVLSRTLILGDITENTVSISWTKAEDDSSEQANLKYIVYYSKDNNVDTVTNIEANGTAAGIYEADIDSKTVTGLEPGTSYYFNVIVKDELENKTAYEAVNVDTSITPTDDVSFYFKADGTIPADSDSVDGKENMKFTIEVDNGVSIVNVLMNNTVSQAVEVSGDNADQVTLGIAQANQTFTVNTEDIKDTGGSKTFYITVSETNKFSLTYLITVSVKSL